MQSELRLEGEPVQVFLDFLASAEVTTAPDGSGRFTGTVPEQTAEAMKRAIDRRALRLRGQDMIRAASEGTPIRTKAQARYDALLELLTEVPLPRERASLRAFDRPSLDLPPKSAFRRPRGHGQYP